MDTQPSAEFLKAFEEAFQKHYAAAVNTEQRASPLPFGTLHQLAATVISFNPAALQRASGNPDPGPVFELLADCHPLKQTDEAERWALDPDVRIRVLRYLRETEQLNRVLGRASQLPTSSEADAIQKIFTRYLAEEPVPAAELTPTQLAFAFQATRWLREAGFTSAPPAAQISQRADWLGLLEPFEHLAADHTFGGREPELAVLRGYAGIQPPRSTLEKFERLVLQDALGLTQKPPLIIHGPGGVGKSTLLARFILEHARAHEHSRFPFVYLDFDRPDVAASEPLSLLIEGVRQLGIEYPEAALQCERLRRDWSAALASGAAADRTARSSNFAAPGAAYGTLRQTIVRDFCNLIDTIGAADVPFLLILDTFEQVQIRSDEYVADIWALLDALRLATPRLRVVIAGRAPLDKAEPLHLLAFDEQASVAYLTSRGIPNAADAQRIFRFVGGTPLALLLALAVARQDPYRYLQELGADTFVALNHERVQRQLYKRFLNNLTGDVQRLAHPGLVLRKLTADLVYRVLRDPCQLSVDSLSEARSLIDKLRVEVSLVRQDLDGSLYHRQDLRLEMIRLLESDKPEQVRQIREAAVRYYSAHDDVKSRAEEIYHRLSLGQDHSELEARWLPGVDPYLVSALPELQGRSKAYLASKLHLEVDAATRDAAELEDWERIVERRAREALTRRRHYADALKLLTARSKYSDLSPLFILKAEALDALGRRDEALASLEEGAQRAIERAAWTQARALVTAAADILLRTSPVILTAAVREQLTALLRAPGTAAERLECLMRLIALTGADRDLRTEARSLFDDLTDEDLEATPRTAYWFVGFAGGRDRRRIARAIRHSGLPRADQGSLRQLAAELVEQDVRSDHALSLEIKSDGLSSFSNWIEFLYSSSDQGAGAGLARLLESGALVDPKPVIEAINTLMQSTLGLHQKDERPFAPSLGFGGPAAAPPPDSVRPSIQWALINALVTAFRDVAALREFLSTRLQLSLDSLSIRSTMEEVTADVVYFAAKSGVLARLVIHARESHPDLIALNLISRELGLTTLVPPPAMIEARRRSSRVISFDWLNDIEGQVCRVEVDSEPQGTAFLVGLDLVLTSAQVVADLISGVRSPEHFGFRFDFKPGSDGTLINPGVVFRLHSDWLVSTTRPGRSIMATDYALLRLAGAPGAQPVGGTRAEFNARPRNWIVLDNPAPSIWPHEGLVIVHYSAAKPLQLLYTDKVIPDSKELPGYIEYEAKNPRGSVGAPCLTLNGELLAVHLGKLKGLRPRPPNLGLPIARANADLEAKGLGHLRRNQLD